MNLLIIIEISLNNTKQKSIDEISIREIANLANVNVASINYYYNSKENLFNEIEKNKDRKQTLFKRGASSVKKMEKGLSKRNPSTSKY